MPADESLGAYQFGRYMFSKERTEAVENAPPYPSHPPTTRYTMVREPNENERDWLGDRNAPAFDVGTLDINHHPPVDPLPAPQVFGTAAGLAAHAEWQQTRKANTVVSKGWHEKHSPRDEVDFLTVEKGSRVMMPTLLGLAQRAAKATTGQDLQASTSLSVHSQRVVDKLKAAGMVPEGHESTRNELTFTTAWPLSAPGGIEGHLSTLRRRAAQGGGEEPIPATEVAAAKEEGRQMVRRARPKRA